jgi:hypothetical protein
MPAACATMALAGEDRGSAEVPRNRRAHCRGAHLERKVRQLLKRDRTLSWDAAVAQVSKTATLTQLPVPPDWLLRHEWGAETF